MTIHCQAIIDTVAKIDLLNTREDLLAIIPSFKKQACGIYDRVQTEPLEIPNTIQSTLQSIRNLQCLKRSIKILLLQNIEQSWYKSHPKFLTEMDVANGRNLVDLRVNRKKILFQFHTVNVNFWTRLNRYIRAAIEPLNSGPENNSVGMMTPFSQPAMVALLNEIQKKISLAVIDARPLQVNSILRTADHQSHLAGLGFMALPNSAHLAGYAADIERRWYFRKERRLFTEIDRILDHYRNDEILNVIDEEDVWHICLNPKFISRYSELWCQASGT